MRRLVKSVLEVVESRLMDPFSLDGLAKVEADLIIAVTVVGVIGNGGHMYWFEGKDAAATLRAASAFERMGLSDVAAALRESLHAFPGGAPPGPLVERQRYISLHRASLEAAFRSLDERVWDAEFDSAVERYIDEHRDDLCAIAPAYAELLRLQ